jgi:hypothetical protein
MLTLSRPWVIRTVGPNQEVDYYLVETNQAEVAKQRVSDSLKALKPNWKSKNLWNPSGCRFDASPGYC